jgi:hypothetical protein
VLIGGAEKVTEGAGATAYVNPFWASSKTQMASLAVHGFVPLAYMFMDAAEAGGAQAEYFASKAGDLAAFGIAVDLERAPNGSPSLAEAQAAVTELRRLYPGHPIGGYAPHWYTGGEDLSFFDWLWASEYVGGSGDPAMLYRAVPASWWAPYGDRTPLLLQFTSSAAIAGISGAVDCSAFQGSAAQFAVHVLRPKPASPPVPAPVPQAPSTARPGDGSMLITLNPGDAPVTFPVWANSAAYEEPAVPYANASLILTGGAGAVLKITFFYGGAASSQAVTHTLAAGAAFAAVPSQGWHKVSVVEVQRLDTKKGVPASATFRTW